MSDTYTITRSTTVDATSDQIYRHVIDFHGWSAWSPWEELDPDMSRSFSGADSGVGAKYAWKGNRKVGEGNMEIVSASDASIEISLEFLKPFKASNDTEFSFAPDGTGTKVTWSMKGTKTFMTKVMGIFKSMDSMVGPDFEKGLAKLKSVAESDRPAT